jgi:hypothetical protein
MIVRAAYPNNFPGPFNYKSEEEIEKGFKVAKGDAAGNEGSESKFCV